jgi:hypothetical protein
LRSAAHGNPDRHLLLLGPRINAEIVDGGPQVSGPGDALALAQLHQQVEFLAKQRIIVIKVVAEERIGLDERAPPRHDFGAAIGYAVNRRILLEHADRIIRREHSDGT